MHTIHGRTITANTTEQGMLTNMAHACMRPHMRVCTGTLAHHSLTGTRIAAVERMSKDTTAIQRLI